MMSRVPSDVPYDRTRRLMLLGPPLALALAACTQEPPEPAALDNRDEGPITFALAGPDISVGKQQLALVDRWRQEHSDQPVEPVELPAGADAQRAQLVAGLQDGRGFDVLSLDVAWMAEFTRFGYLRALPAEELDAAEGSSRFLQRPLDSCRVDGQLMAMPYTTNAGFLYYNTNVLEQIGLTRGLSGTDWDGVVKNLSAWTLHFQFGGALDGYATQLAEYEGLTVNVLESVWDAGGEIMTDAGQVEAGSDAALEGLQRLVEGLAEGWIPQAALGFREEETRQAFQQGRLLFMRNWPYAYRSLNAEGAPLAGAVNVDRLPGPSALGGQNLAISRHTVNQGTALEFIRFMVRQDNQRLLFEQGGFPSVLQAVYADEEVRQAHPYVGLLRDSVESARFRPRTPYYPWVSEAIAHHASLALQDQVPPDQAMGDLAEELEAILDRV